MKCINKSIKAWRNLAEKREEFSETAKKFLSLLDSLNKEFEKLDMDNSTTLLKKKLK